MAARLLEKSPTPLGGNLPRAVLPIGIGGKSLSVLAQKSRFSDEANFMLRHGPRVV